MSPYITKLLFVSGLPSFNALHAKFLSFAHGGKMTQIHALFSPTVLQLYVKNYNYIIEVWSPLPKIFVSAAAALLVICIGLAVMSSGSAFIGMFEVFG